MKWINGSQNYDAILYTSKSNISISEKSLEYVEITTAVIPNSYLVREHLNKHGISWSAKTTGRDLKTKEVISKPHVFTNGEHINDLLRIIDERIEDKKSKEYPNDTVLLILIEPDMIIYNSEWKELIKNRISFFKTSPFKELYLMNSKNDFIVNI